MCAWQTYGVHAIERVSRYKPLADENHPVSIVLQLVLGPCCLPLVDQSETRLIAL